MKQNLYRSWIDLGHELELNPSEIEKVWEVFSTHYGQPQRHYHNFSHLAAMFKWMTQVHNQIEEITSLKLATWFHDLIYNPKRKDNEILSAEQARIYMEEWGVETRRIEYVEKLILSTAKHSPFIEHVDFHLFLDIDLAILGSNPETYHAYTEAIRKEYSTYPYFLYRIGRKKVLQHFLKRPYIYFSNDMRQKLERQARINMEKELLNL